LSPLTYIRLRQNSGQTAAMMAGIDHAAGDIIIPLDGDMQNDPWDIPKLIAKLDEGYDVVSGWRKDRKDFRVKRTLVSRIANVLISKISGVPLHDYGCSLKAYTRDVIKDVKLYGEMHRFIPIYATWQGGRVAEIVVTHHPRKFGKSKYGLERTFKVVLDLIVIKFLQKYSQNSIYLFGGSMNPPECISATAGFPSSINPVENSQCGLWTATLALCSTAKSAITVSSAANCKRRVTSFKRTIPTRKFCCTDIASGEPRCLTG
jgi:glycosyltransferase involved in cell wall biosynthesis